MICITYCIVVLLCYGNTALPHYDVDVLYTYVLLQCRIAILLSCCIVVLLYCYIIVLLYCCIAVVLYCCIVVSMG